MINALKNTAILAIKKLLKFKRNFILQNAISSGMHVGAGTIFVGNQSFGSEPYLIDIGKNCRITNGVNFICHDGAWCVACGVQGIPLSESAGKKTIFGSIKVGDNSFLGINAIILPGTRIGKNSIVAAGAVVRGSFPDGSVIAGNPAKVIGEIQSYIDKNKHMVVDTPSTLSSIERKFLAIKATISE